MASLTFSLPYEYDPNMTVNKIVGPEKLWNFVSASVMLLLLNVNNLLECMPPPASTLFVTL